MKGLKFAAIACVALLAVMILFVGYLFLTAEVQVVTISAQGVQADHDLEAFEKLKTSIDEATFYGTLYQKPLEWKEAAEYVYLTYDIQLRNNCLVPLDMIEIQVVPQSDDILQLPALETKALDLKSEGAFTAQILASKDTHPIREIIVTYYIWGVSGNIKTVYGQ